MAYPAWIQNIMNGTDTPERMAVDFPWAEKMIGCPHDAVYHAEGDPWTHTCMVVEQLRTSAGFDDLDRIKREILLISAWGHDIAKPMTTECYWDEKQQRDRVSQPGHARLGAEIMWHHLVDAGYDTRKARDVHSMIFWHQRPTHMLDQNNIFRRSIELGAQFHHMNWQDMLRLCRADQDGRICLQPDGGDDNLELLRIYLEDASVNAGADLTTSAFPFASDEARLRFLNSKNNELFVYTPQPAQGSRMILMSGLPGSGKDTAIQTHFPDLPVVSLDDLREEMGIKHGKNQGAVIQKSLEMARKHLRKGEDFVWNATNLSRFARQKIIRLARDYDARIDAVSIDVPLSVAKARNSGRQNPLPDAAIDALANKREPICVTETHALYSVNEHLELERIFGVEQDRPEMELQM
jgi:predicted kinase